MRNIPEDVLRIIEGRQKEKFAAIRPVPIFDRELHIPVRDTEIRVLEYIPQDAAGALPVFFDLHGGGFTTGYPEEDDLLCRKLCDSLHIRVFSIEYRLAPQYPYPIGQLDAYEVVSYFHSHAEAYGILPDQMVIGGHSAGANLTAATVIRGSQSGAFSFQGAVMNYPPLDFVTSAWDKPVIEGSVPPERAAIFDQCYSEPGQEQEYLCSILYTPDELLKLFPPTVVMTCECDALREEGEKFALRLAQNGVEVTMRRFLGAKHGCTVEYGTEAADQTYAMIAQSLARFFHK